MIYLVFLIIDDNWNYSVLEYFSTWKVGLEVQKFFF